MSYWPPIMATQHLGHEVLLYFELMEEEEALLSLVGGHTIRNWESLGATESLLP